MKIVKFHYFINLTVFWQILERLHKVFENHSDAPYLLVTHPVVSRGQSDKTVSVCVCKHDNHQVSRLSDIYSFFIHKTVTESEQQIVLDVLSCICRFLTFFTLLSALDVKWVAF